MWKGDESFLISFCRKASYHYRGKSSRAACPKINQITPQLSELCLIAPWTCRERPIRGHLKPTILRIGNGMALHRSSVCRWSSNDFEIGQDGERLPLRGDGGLEVGDRPFTLVTEIGASGFRLSQNGACSATARLQSPPGDSRVSRARSRQLCSRVRSISL
jgi:hypothetical protein